MSADSSLDRESFQQFLASAFAVQQSQIDSQFLSAIVEMQRLITRGELGLDSAMHLVVDSAREVANAAGVVIGLLDGDQLIYRAGSGCSATSVGTRVAASLTVSADTTASREILRVENAQTDTTIKAAICRQLGAESLLILPIYRDRGLAGVLEVLFSEAHAFQDREVRSYRLMARLIEAAMLQASQGVEETNLTLELPSIPQASEQDPPRNEGFFNHKESLLGKGKRAISSYWGATLAAVGESSALKRPALLATKIVGRAKAVTWYRPPWNVGLAAVAIVLGLTLWIAYGRGPASPLRSSAPTSAPPGSTAIEPPDRFESAKAVPTEGTSQGLPATVPVPVQKAGQVRTAVRRARVGGNEVDYIGDDVTVRHFTYKPASQRGGASRVATIGEDVTVRYFTPKPAVRSESR